MTDVALERPARSRLARKAAASPERRLGGAFYGYAATSIALGLGWLLRERQLVDPAGGAGYWLGIVGASMMLLLLTYPLRKRIRLARFLGATKHWFRAHMILGVAGPVLVLYHCNFRVGSVNSRVALVCMLLVAGSGIVGRHLYARIHRGLYGEKATLQQLQEDLSEALRDSQGVASLLPGVLARLETLAAELQGDRITKSLGARNSLRWMLRRYHLRFSLARAAKRELRARAAQSETVARNYPRLRRASSAYVRDFVRLMGRVAQFSLYERLFSLWHVLHLPLFFMMVLAALVHVLAVHLY